VDAAQELTLSSARLTGWAREAGFELVGFARAEPIPPRALTEWIAAGFDADLDWMKERLAERLDIRKLFPGARTVVALANNYWRTDAPSPIARYARGRDYHYTMKDRLKALRRSLRANAAHVDDFASVDTSAVMEKVWATRAGLGYVGRNGCLITERFGSWVVLATMVLNAEVDAYAAEPVADRCGKCTLCVTACPTGAIVADRTVDARACLSYQTIENPGSIPEAHRPALRGFVFGCDICQEVCPLNREPLAAMERFAPRPVSALSVAEIAALSAEQFKQLAAGTPLARAQYDGMRRNAAYALGAVKDVSARGLLEKLAADPSANVAEAARWALAQL
jgi:epoxyqueuosine reductase